MALVALRLIVLVFSDTASFRERSLLVVENPRPTLDRCSSELDAMEKCYEMHDVPKIPVVLANPSRRKNMRELSKVVDDPRGDCAEVTTKGTECVYRDAAESPSSESKDGSSYVKIIFSAIPFLFVFLIFDSPKLPSRKNVAGANYLVALQHLPGATKEEDSPSPTTPLSTRRRNPARRFLSAKNNERPSL